MEKVRFVTVESRVVLTWNGMSACTFVGLAVGYHIPHWFIIVLYIIPFTSVGNLALLPRIW